MTLPKKSKKQYTVVKKNGNHKIKFYSGRSFRFIYTLHKSFNLEIHKLVYVRALGHNITAAFQAYNPNFM